MKTKLVPVAVKAAGLDDGLGDGEFIAYASVFGNVDRYGDVVQPGAFADSLAEWAKSESVLPVLWGHDFSDPFSNIGAVLDAEEDAHGLKVTARLDLENPKALQVYKMLKGRRVTQMSFAYDIVEGSPRKDEERGDYYSLDKLKIHEVSVVPLGANEETEILTVKGALDVLATKAERGGVAPGLIDSLHEMREAIGAVIEAATGGHDQEKASGTPEAKSGASDEEPDRAKSSVPDEEPVAGPSVDILAAQATIYALNPRGKGVQG